MAATDPRTLGAQPAVPHHQVEESETYSRTYAQHHGISKREFFVGCALMGCAAADDFDADRFAANAGAAADAALSMLAEG